ncbi:hypothetical protein PIB30_002477 [Stylosanthes scabra]|uniref:Uncharacterized protein n=1 Tax=Stylosanthes scabra TaxID=79078 RepID=A0ABU6X0L1_9FABA|nr:hypothetical protein [Stylosanthes scabra]
MGYANEALHLPGISKRLEFDLAMKSNDLKRALQCLHAHEETLMMGDAYGIPPISPQFPENSGKTTCWCAQLRMTFQSLQ